MNLSVLDWMVATIAFILALLVVLYIVPELIFWR